VESWLPVLLDEGALDRSESPDLELSMLVRGLEIVAMAEADRCVSKWVRFLICNAFINLIFSGVTPGLSRARDDACEGGGRL